MNIHPWLKPHQTNMRYGHFDDQNRKCVITEPDTPLPWMNCLGCESGRWFAGYALCACQQFFLFHNKSR
jgi:hypothetical protein